VKIFPALLERYFEALFKISIAFSLFLVKLCSFHPSRGALAAVLCCATLAEGALSARTALPLPVRNERGEGRGEGHLTADSPTRLHAKSPSSPLPSPPLAGREGEETGARMALASAQDTVQLRTNYYNISGATEMELRQSINQSRPWKDKDATDARTEWKVQWNYSTRPADGGYRLRSLQTRTTITYTLPRWIPGPSSPNPLREHWARYNAALRMHEEGHARIALVAAGE